MKYYEVRLEEKEDTIKWLEKHRHKFLCQLYENICYAQENKLDRIKVLRETIGDGFFRKTVREVGMELNEFKGEGFLKNTMLKHFEREEDYDKCKNIAEWIKRINKKNLEK